MGCKIKILVCCKRFLLVGELICNFRDLNSILLVYLLVVIILILIDFNGCV